MGNVFPSRVSDYPTIPEQLETLTDTNPSAKILMLGTGSCGKTSIFKQIKLCYGTLDAELSKSEILHNIADTFIKLVAYCNKHQIEFESQENAQDAVKALSQIPTVNMSNEHFTSEIIQLCKKLWNDKNVQKHFFDACREMCLSDGVTQYDVN